MEHRRVQYSQITFSNNSKQSWFTYVQIRNGIGSYAIDLEPERGLSADTEEDLKIAIDEFILENGPIDLWDCTQEVRDKYKRLKVDLDGYLIVNKADKSIIRGLQLIGADFRAVDDTKINDILL